MPKRYSDEIKAAAVAAVQSGETQASVAKRFGTSPGRLNDWRRRYGAIEIPQRSAIEQRTRERMGELIYDTLIDLLTTVRVQLRAATDEEWLEKQSAADVAQLLGTEFDRAIRLLAGLRPVEPGDELDAIDGAVVDAVPGAADAGDRERG